MALGLLALAVAAVCAGSGQPVAALWLAVNGLVLTLGVAWERWRYKSTLSRRPPGNWRPTGERFVDPETGRLTEVYYDPATGERSYVQDAQPPR
ncbi:MAG: hypothetical protein KGJ55_02785 [Gammaproteobacteria bacterium]|nr:hypothetical protein [Gammaproteobacteria bacterium]